MTNPVCQFPHCWRPSEFEFANKDKSVVVFVCEQHFDEGKRMFQSKYNEHKISTDG